jgi:hypothetical protein
MMSGRDDGRGLSRSHLTFSGEVVRREDAVLLLRSSLP